MPLPTRPCAAVAASTAPAGTAGADRGRGRGRRASVRGTGNGLAPQSPHRSRTALAPPDARLGTKRNRPPSASADVQFPARPHTAAARHAVVRSASPLSHPPILCLASEELKAVEPLFPYVISCSSSFRADDVVVLDDRRPRATVAAGSARSASSSGNCCKQRMTVPSVAPQHS